MLQKLSLAVVMAAVVRINQMSVLENGNRCAGDGGKEAIEDGRREQLAERAARVMLAQEGFRLAQHRGTENGDGKENGERGS